MPRQPATGKELFNALFEPRSIALVGASGDAKKNTSRPQRYLRKHGYTGRIVPVNPGRDEIFGEKAYPDIASIPEAVDHAFIMAPAKAVKAAIEQCAAKGIAVATIYSDGFAETGPEGRREQDEILAIARAGGVRVIGPNCIGLVNTDPGCAITVNAVLDLPQIKTGPLALVSHSGSLNAGHMSRGLGRGVGFSKLVSVGNESDLSVGEFADLLVDDAHTQTILLFMETLRDADKLAHAARRAYAIGKRIIVYKLGRSEVGQDLAASHTGAMAGSDEMADAFFRAHSILRVDTLENLFELPVLLKGQQPARRHRVAIMTTTGGGAASVADRLGTLGVEVVAPTDEVVAKLAAQNVTISKARLTDLTLAGAKKEIYSAVLNTLLHSDHCDLVLAVAGSSAQFQPQVAIEPLMEADTKGKPLASFAAPHAETSLKLLMEAGIAGFRTPESCADAIRAWRDWAPPVEQPKRDEKRLGAAGKLLAQAGAQLDEYASGEVFDALGVPRAATAVLRKPEDKANLPYPVVAKILSRDILHKTDAGGVVLSIADAKGLESAAADILRNVAAKHPNAAIDGILVQRMEKGLAELILGYKRDPQVGPVVVLGVGGVLAEIYKDFAVRLAPVSEADARAMIDEVKGLAVIRGYRGMPKGDLEALARAVSAFSQIAFIDDVAEAEINPLMVKREGEGVVAVDGLIVRRAVPARLTAR
jgi:acyl-CoA synthetase (NDP forming)